MGMSGKIFRMRSAPISRRPNGVDVRCCSQVAKYLEDGDYRIKFRCLQPEHRGPRNFYITLLLDEVDNRWIVGVRKRDRAMIDCV